MTGYDSLSPFSHHVPLTGNRKLEVSGVRSPFRQVQRRPICQDTLPRRCNGQMAMLKPEAVPRVLLAALLQTGWGVAPSYETWSVFHNATLHDWLWSIGRTPFGPLSDVLGISFVQRTAAQRNVVLTLLHRAVEEAGEMLRTVQVGRSDRSVATLRNFGSR